MASSQGCGADVTSQTGDEEDDYLNMVLEDVAPAQESSVVRAQRLKREARARGFVKSRAQLAQEEKETREKALSTSLFEKSRAQGSKGLYMMAKMGFSGGGLGKATDQGGGGLGEAEPIKLKVLGKRSGIGLESENKRRLDEEAAAAAERQTKAVKVEPQEFRQRASREREEAKRERQLHAAQRVAERLDEELHEADEAGERRGAASRPLKSLPIVYRDLVRHREEQQRDRRMRQEIELNMVRMPSRVDYGDDSDDSDDGAAAESNQQGAPLAADEVDGDDAELDDFNALPVQERLLKVVGHLRDTHRYCFWCKMTYLDAQMEGCPGLTEDHD